jgi:hypothetical protein
VSLLVEPKQAEALQLAVENGSITMSLRNPLDKLQFATEGSVLNRNTILSSGSTVPSTVLPTTPSGQEFLDKEQWYDVNEPQGQRITSDNTIQGNMFDTQKAKPYPVKSRWPVEFYLGQKKKIEEFDVPEGKAENTAQKN